MGVGLGADPKGRKPMIVTPFQIFCHRVRDSAARSHPHLRGIAITALLGQMWRALDEPGKDYYRDLSMKLRESKHGQGMSEISEARSDPDPGDLLCQLPRFGVTPHHHFGMLAAKASAAFLQAYCG